MPYNATRAAIKSAYPGSTKWAKKVDLMSDGQLVAVYFRLFNEGKIKSK